MKAEYSPVVRELWENGFFSQPRRTNEVTETLRMHYNMYPANIGVTLKRAVFLRQSSQGWVQKIPYSRNSSLENKLSIEDDRLKDICSLNFSAGSYWDCLFSALRHLEVRVREKANLSADVVGVDLMETAFKPREGVLKVPFCATSGEQDGFKQIMKGMMLFHRNAKGHREEVIDANSTIAILNYISYLLKIVDSSTLR